MKAMVMWNIFTDADLVNDTRGKIEHIILDPWEDPHMLTGRKVSLKYTLIMMVFKPMNSVTINLAGLTEGLIPIFPTKSTFSITTPSSRRTTVTCRQLALMASYCFMHYCSQGQTIKYVVVDLGKVPNGTLSPFNAYVALL